jgi:HEPN domain-containing protein
MNTLVDEWISKAEGDFTTANRELRARKAPNYDACCFHCQQCAEKYLKPFLQSNKRDIPKIHNLLDLLKLCKEVDTGLEILHADLREIEGFSVSVRYPGTNATRDDALTVFKSVNAVRNFLRQRLGLK